MRKGILIALLASLMTSNALSVHRSRISGDTTVPVAAFASLPIRAMVKPHCLRKNSSGLGIGALYPRLMWARRRAQRGSRAGFGELQKCVPSHLPALAAEFMVSDVIFLSE